MIDAIEILELKIGIVFYGYLDNVCFERLNKKIEHIKKEEKLQFVINFLENRNCKIKKIANTKFNTFSVMTHLI